MSLALSFFSKTKTSHTVKMWREECARALMRLWRHKVVVVVVSVLALVPVLAAAAAVEEAVVIVVVVATLETHRFMLKAYPCLSYFIRAIAQESRDTSWGQVITD